MNNYLDSTYCNEGFVPDTREIDRLESLMRERHPQWGYIRRECNGDHQVCVLRRNGHIRASAVIHYFSYGHEAGLLEFWDGECDPMVVDAEEALALFEKALEGREAKP